MVWSQYVIPNIVIHGAQTPKYKNCLCCSSARILSWSLKSRLDLTKQVSIQSAPCTPTGKRRALDKRLKKEQGMTILVNLIWPLFKITSQWWKVGAILLSYLVSILPAFIVRAYNFHSVSAKWFVYKYIIIIFRTWRRTCQPMCWFG